MPKLDPSDKDLADAVIVYVRKQLRLLFNPDARYFLAMELTKVVRPEIIEWRKLHPSKD